MAPASDPRFRGLLVAVFALLTALALAAPAWTVPRTVVHIDAENCDPLFIPSTVDELGFGVQVFADFDEEISASDQATLLDACPPVDTDNVLVTITNLTTRDFTEVWYVGDEETSLANFDGFADRAGGVCHLSNTCPAFRIDAVGLNQPLVFESIAADGVFQSGETWEFIIDDYFNSLAIPASEIRSVGVGTNSPGGLSSGSIIAIPEPGTILLAGLAVTGLAFLGRKRPKR